MTFQLFMRILKSHTYKQCLVSSIDRILGCLSRDCRICILKKSTFAGKPTHHQNTLSTYLSVMPTNFWTASSTIFIIVDFFIPGFYSFGWIHFNTATTCPWNVEVLSCAVSTTAAIVIIRKVTHLFISDSQRITFLTGFLLMTFQLLFKH